MNETTAQPFTLVGGPYDGTPIVQDLCEHGHWPDLVHEHGSGFYRFDEATGRYTWQEGKP